MDRTIREIILGKNLIFDIHDNPNIILLKICFGADVNAKINDDAPLLEHASLIGNTEIVKILLENAADPNYINISGNSPLLVAIRLGNIRTITLLLSYGANAKSFGRGRLFRSPLQEASIFGSTTIVKLLLKYGADVNEVYPSGKTALITASEFNNAGVVDLLIDCGANINVKDRKGHTALSRALIIGNSDIVTLLRERGGTE